MRPNERMRGSAGDHSNTSMYLTHKGGIGVWANNDSAAAMNFFADCEVDGGGVEDRVCQPTLVPNWHHTG